jgi:RecB family exonuclease
MKITFGLELDGYQAVESRQALESPICGPLGLLQLLETRLGLKAKTSTTPRRVVQFRGLVEQLAGEGAAFYGESFKKDPYAVAETLLRWRDDLIASGWNGQASSDSTLRLRDMAALEARAAAHLSPGPADRLRAILRELELRSAKIKSLTVRNPRAHLSKLWQNVCDKLAADYAPAPLSAGAEAPDSDLGRVQSLLLDSSRRQVIRLAGDQSVIFLTAFSETTLASGVSQMLAAFRRKGGAAATLLADGRAGCLEQALMSQDEPTVGLQPSSTARPIPQELLLALRLCWKPVDPRALLEFLTHPVCPVAGPLRRRLAEAIAESPGVGGPRWQEAIESMRESITASARLKADERKDYLERVEQDLKNWVGVAGFDARTGAPGSVLSECCARVARWAASRSGAAETPPPEQEQFLALAALGSEMADLLRSLPAVTRSQLERMLHQVTGAGWSSGSTMAQLGHVHRVAQPGAVHEAVDAMVWWDFTEPAAPARPPWTRQELDQLHRQGAEFPDAETVAEKESRGWLRPVLATRRQLVLVLPRQRAGEPVARHPLHARLLSMIDSKGKPLPVIDLDKAVSSGQAGDPFRFATVERRPLPTVRRWWKLRTSRHLGPRDQESYSSAEKFIYSPYAWVFRYKAGLQAGPMAGLRLQDDHRQKGTLLHRLLDLLLAAPASEVDWRNVSQPAFERWVDARWPALLEQEAANLLLPGKCADSLALLEQGKMALFDLLDQLRRAKVMEARSNESLATAPFVGGQISGIIDLLVRNSKKELAIVDLKFGGRRVREKELQESRPLQLAVYGYLLSNQNKGLWPAAGFYILRDRRLLTPGDSFFPSARVVASKFPPGNIEQCWADFERVWRWRRRQFDDGWIEMTVGDAEPTSGSEGFPDSTPPVSQWLANEDHAKFNEYDSLTGWRADA